MQKNIEDLFLEHIYQRGVVYYKQNKVENVVITKNKIEAIVKGTEKYSVSINILNANIESMHCNCKYFESSGNCKHLAALSEYMKNNCQTYTKNQEKNLKKNIDKIEVEELRKFVKDMMLEDNRFAKKITGKFQKYFETKDIAIFKDRIIELKNKILESIVTEEEFYEDNYYDEDDLEEFEEIDNYKKEIESILNELCIYNEVYGENDCLIVIRSILENIPYVEEGIAYEGYYYSYREMLKNLDFNIAIYLEKITKRYEDISEKIIDIILKNTNDIENTNNYITVLEYIQYLIDNKLHIHKLEKILLIYISKAKNKQKYVLILSEIYDKQNKYTEKLELLKTNRQTCGVAKKLVKTLFENKEYLECIKYAKELVYLKDNYDYLEDEEYYSTTDYRYNMLNYILKGYLKLNDIQSYNKTLIEMIIKYNFRKIELYIKLKENTSGENWEKVYSKLIENIKHSEFILEIYAYEKDFENLLNEVKLANKYTYVKKYDKLLMHKYEEELFDIVILNVFVLLKNGQGRQCSIEACEMLKYLEKYTKMQMKLDDEIKNLVEKFSARRSFKEELKKYKLDRYKLK